MKNKNLYIIIISLFSSLAHADNKQAIAYYAAGIPIAKELFEQALSSSNSSEQAEAYYYLGEIAYNKGEIKDALSYYQKGWECLKSYPYNKVGEGKVWLTSNKDVAKASFDLALKIDKKDAAVYVAIAAAYSANNLQPDADKAIKDAMQYNSKNPRIYIYEGDMLFANKKYGEAAGKYEQAIYFDPECSEAYLKYAEVYRLVNPTTAIDMLQKLTSLDPDNILAYRSLGDIYLSLGSYSKAIEAYKKYSSGNLYSVDDLIHYASALFFSGKNEEAGKIMDKGLSMDPDNFLIKRLCFYNAYETKNYGKGIECANSFFSIPNGNFIWQDYLYYGKLLKANKQNEKALEVLLKAIQLDKAHPEIYKEIADVYGTLDNFPMAIHSYSSYITSPNVIADVTDYFILGKYYYAAATNDSINQHIYIQKGDSLFAIVSEKAPDSYIGPFWQARIKSLLDPETEQGLAKPYYEACLSILEKDKQKYIKELIECYRYLGYYYYLQKSMNDSKNYWNKIVQIDPDNTVAKEALKKIK